MGSILSADQKLNIARVLAKKTNIPWKSEKKERNIYMKLLTKLDDALYDEVPNEVLEDLNRSEAIEEWMREKLEEKIADIVVKVVASFGLFPIIWAEPIVRVIVGLLLKAFFEAIKLDEVLETALQDPDVVVFSGTLPQAA